MWVADTPTLHTTDYSDIILTSYNKTAIKLYGETETESLLQLHQLASTYTCLYFPTTKIAIVSFSLEKLVQQLPGLPNLFQHPCECCVTSDSMVAMGNKSKCGKHGQHNEARYCSTSEPQ